MPNTEQLTKPKRKTKTSSAAKNRYAKKMYTRISVNAPKQLAADFKAKAAEQKTTPSAIFKQAMADYIEKHS